MDSFDCQIQCEEIDWVGVNVPDIMVDGIPLDSKYLLEHLIDSIDF